MRLALISQGRESEIAFFFLVVVVLVVFFYLNIAKQIILKRIFYFGVLPVSRVKLTI